MASQVPIELCEVCGQRDPMYTPSCHLLYLREHKMCRALAHHWLQIADSAGDGPLVNALCEMGRRKWGACLHW